MLFSQLSKAQQTFCIDNAISDMMYDVVQTSDGGYALGGTEGSDFHIYKTDANANVQWARQIGGTNWEGLYSLIQSSDGGYLLGGISDSYGAGWADVYFVKLDATGNIQWTRTVGGANSDQVTSVIQTSDGGYVGAGGTQSFGAGLWDVYIVKLNSSGTVVWTRTIGGTNNDGDLLGTSVIQTTDGGYVIVSTTSSFDTQSYDLYIIKLDSGGNLVWTKTAGGPLIEEPHAIVQTGDKGFAIAGRTGSFGGESYYLVKTDSTGNVQWTKTAGGNNSDQCFGMTKTSDKGFLLIGRSMSFVSAYYDAYLVKFDSTGTFMWSETVGSSNPQITEEPWEIIQTSDGGYSFVGGTRDFSSGPSAMKAYFVKLNSAGNGCCLSGINQGTIGTGGSNHLTGGIQGSGGTSSSGGGAFSFGSLQQICFNTSLNEYVADNAVSVAPNPFSESTYISTSRMINNGSLNIYNTTGQIVRQIKLSNIQVIELAKEGLSPGLYFFHIEDGSKIRSNGKLIISD